MQREGVFREIEMKRRKAYEKPSERKTREKTEPSDACGRPPGNRLSAKVYSRCLNAGKMHAVLLRGPGRSEFSASSTALDRTRPTSAHQINLQMSPRRITGSPDSRSLTSWIRFAAGTGGYMSALWYAEAPKSRQAPSHSCPGMIGGTDRVTNDWSRDPGPGHLPQVLLTTNSVRRELVGLKDALHRPQADPRRPSCIRPVQWVASPGGGASARSITRFTVLGGNGSLSGLRDLSRTSPSTPSAMKRACQSGGRGGLGSVTNLGVRPERDRCGWY